MRRRYLCGALVGILAPAAALATVWSSTRLDLDYRAPGIHVGLETTAAITASGAAFLLLGRFWRRGFLDELLLSAGLALVALANLAFAALPAVFHLATNGALVWGSLCAGLLAALMVCLAALLPRRRIPGGPTWPLAVYAGTLALALAVVGAIVLYRHHLPPVVSSQVGGLRPHPVAHPAALALQLDLAVLYLLAAFGFARRYRRTHDELNGWLTVACVFSTAARVSYALHPALDASWVSTGDVFRLGFYLALLIGAAREIASYWTSAVAAASLEERRRIARDVHDGLAQEIAFIGRNARALREDFDPELVDRILESVVRARDESRRVVGALTSKPDEPLEQALAQATREAAGRYGATVDVQVASGIALPPREREAIVRIASEATANAARHSGADRLQLNLERLEAGVRLEIVDDGVGFEPEPYSGGGFGLITMRDRAEALGARLRIDSHRGAGTRVELEL